MTNTVPVLTIIGMAATLLISVGIPVITAIVWIKKTKAKVTALIIGAGTFIVFALILEQIMHYAVGAAAGEALKSNIWLYALYGGLAAALFEETGRFLSMKFLMKKTLAKRNGVMFGIGHGGIEALILVGLAYVSNIFTAVLINSGLLETALSGLDEPLRSQSLEQISVLWTAPPYQFFIAGIERIFAFALQICLSYIVYRAVKDKKPAVFAAAFAIHFVIDAGLAVLTNTIPLPAVEAVFAAAVALVSVFVFKAYRKEKEEKTGEPEPSADTEENE